MFENVYKPEIQNHYVKLESSVNKVKQLVVPDKLGILTFTPISGKLKYDGDIFLDGDPYVRIKVGNH